MIDIEKGLLFFDTETTWIIKNDKNEIISNWSLIQFASRLVKSWEKKDINLFFLTNTPIEISAMAIHWIYPDLLKKKSGWKYLWEKDRVNLSKIMTENIIIAHNIDFDIDVLNKEQISCTQDRIDTLKVARIMLDEWVLKNSSWKQAEYVNLQYLRYFFELYEIKDADWVIECTTAHDAFWDVVVLENVFYKLFEIVKNKLNLNDDEVIEKMIEMSKKEFVMVKTMRIWKYRGKTFEEVASIDKWYLEWMLKAEFSEDLKYTARVWLWQIEDKKFFS